MKNRACSISRQPRAAIALLLLLLLSAGALPSVAQERESDRPQPPVVAGALSGLGAPADLEAAMDAATSGIGALIPLLDFGTELDSNCRALLSEAKSDAGIKTSDMAPRKRK